MFDAPDPRPPAVIGVLDPIQDDVLLPFFPYNHPSAAPHCGATRPAGAPSPYLHCFTFHLPDTWNVRVWKKLNSTPKIRLAESQVARISSHSIL